MGKQEKAKFEEKAEGNRSMTEYVNGKYKKQKILLNNEHLYQVSFQSLHIKCVHRKKA